MKYIHNKVLIKFQKGNPPRALQSFHLFMLSTLCCIYGKLLDNSWNITM